MHHSNQVTWLLAECPVTVKREQYAWLYRLASDNFFEKKLLTRSLKEKLWYNSNYWLAPDQKDGGEFVLSLGCERTVNLVELVNTNNGLLRDRATKEFKVFISRSLNVPWQEVLHTTLVDSRRHPDPLPLQTFPFPKSSRLPSNAMVGDCRYLQSNIIPNYGRDRRDPEYQNNTWEPVTFLRAFSI